MRINSELIKLVAVIWALVFTGLLFSSNQSYEGDKANRSEVAIDYLEEGRIALTSGNLNKAIASFEQALSINSDSCFAGSEQSIAATLGLARAFRRLGEFQKSRVHYERLLSDSCAKDPLPSEIKINALLEVSNIMFVNNFYNESLDFLQQGLKLAIHELGEVDPRVILFRIKLAEVWIGKGDYGKAFEYVEQSLRDSLKILGERHIYVAMALRAKGKISYFLGDMDKAITNYNEALDTIQNWEGGDTISLLTKPSFIADTNLSIGLALSVMGDYDSAFAHIRLAKVGYEKLYGEQHYSVVNAHNQLGLVLLRKSDNLEAIKHFQSALKLNKERFGKDDLLVANTHMYLGDALVKASEHNLSIEHYLRALKIYSENFGDNHFNVGQAHNFLGLAHRNSKQRIKHFQSADRIFKDILFRHHTYRRHLKTRIDYYKKTGIIL